MSPTSGGWCCRTRGGTGKSCLEPKERCTLTHHTRVWILVSVTPGCFLDAPEPGLLCREELTTSTQLELWGKNPITSNCPIRGRTTSGDSKFSANSAGLPTSQADQPWGQRNPLLLDWQRLPGHVQCGPTCFPVPACFLQLALTQQHHSVDACKLLRNVNCAVLKLRC